jgi:outer membrane protein assembly factor BamD
MKIRRFFSILSCLLLLIACSKDDVVYQPKIKEDPVKLYKEGLNAFEENNFFYANKKFEEAELNFTETELAAKSSLMSSYALYGMNFYNEAEENLKRYLKTYPADKNVKYAHYLIAVIYYEQISDEKKDIAPLIKARDKMNFYIEKYPNTEYAIDLKFKIKLIRTQLAAKELYIARYYISTQKWVPAINRLKNIINDYEETIFIEEALHRLVEIYYYLGLTDEAEKYAQILGYNFNTSEWFEKSYKLFNKDYKIVKKKNLKSKEKNFFKKIVNIIKK